MNSFLIFMMISTFFLGSSSQCITKEYNDNKYNFCKTPLNRNDAMTNCKKLKSNLVSISNINENN